MAKNISDPKIWYKIINKLNETELNYVLVGGAALVIHGLPKSTIDIDIYVPAKEEVLNKLFKIADFLGLKTEQKDILKISHLPNLFVNQWICFSYKGQDILDVFFASEKEFNKLYINSQQKNDRTTTIRVASLKDIETMKKKSSRPRDRDDLKFIKEAKKYKKI
ncbi:MAG: hypothetical protein JSV34_00090 [Candidatus Omnitrophota bacterium]|nr:MAG: hypothetical protein JSV34_00090 [Candidatus Omnitrophota bacterium]